jgi:hypothetical protein
MHLGVDHTHNHEQGLRDLSSNSVCGHKMSRGVPVVHHAWLLSRDEPMIHELHKLMQETLHKRSVVEVEPVTSGDDCAHWKNREYVAVVGKNSLADVTGTMQVHILRPEMNSAGGMEDQ